MLELDNDAYLGALAVVVRWLPAQMRETWQHLYVRHEHYTGTVIAYIDQEVSHQEIEHHALHTLPVTYCEDATKLTQQLAAPLQGIGLVYLGCHGSFVYSDDPTSSIGLLPHSSDKLSLLDLSGLPVHSEPRPVLFVNACHSARLLRDDTSRNISKLYGLPEVLLAHVASGYIGTLGPVGSAYAAQIAKAILTEAYSLPEGVHIADKLRQLRQSAVDQLTANDASDENWLRFIYTFMYVYYGNPLARLRLPRADAEEPGHA